MEPFDRFPPAVKGAGQRAPSYFFTAVLIFEILLSLITISVHKEKQKGSYQNVCCISTHILIDSFFFPFHVRCSIQR